MRRVWLALLLVSSAALAQPITPDLGTYHWRSIGPYRGGRTRAIAGVPQRRGESQVAPLLFAGVQLLHRRLFAGAGELPAKFSLTRLYDRAQEAGRLRGIVHDGEWYHIGTPAGLAAAENRLAITRVER